MVELYVIKQDLKVSVVEEYTLDIIFQEIFEKELKNATYHYCGDEFLEYCFEYLNELMPYYIKAKGTQLYSDDIVNAINIINNHYGHDSYDSYHLSIIEVEDSKEKLTREMIEEIGLDNYLNIKNTNMKVRL
ncbi:hypothetical protein BUY22_02400 [Staphylococcus cohnii]|nr:hypothetical protein BUY22_02400 [Staphylococcus cohnii]